MGRHINSVVIFFRVDFSWWRHFNVTPRRRVSPVVSQVVSTGKQTELKRPRPAWMMHWSLVTVVARRPSGAHGNWTTTDIARTLCRTTTTTTRFRSRPFVVRLTFTSPSLIPSLFQTRRIYPPLHLLLGGCTALFPTRLFSTFYFKILSPPLSVFCLLRVCCFGRVYNAKLDSTVFKRSLFQTRIIYWLLRLLQVLSVTTTPVTDAHGGKRIISR